MPNYVNIKVDNFAPILKLLDKLPADIRAKRGVTDKALRAAAPIIVDAALSEVPDSDQTGTRYVQSGKSKRIWKHKLRRMISFNLVKYNYSSFVVVGAKNPEGNMAHFVQPKNRRHILWGKKEALAGYRYTRDWMRIAWRKSQSAFLNKLRTVLSSEIDKIMRGK